MKRRIRILWGASLAALPLLSGCASAPDLDRALASGRTLAESSILYAADGTPITTLHAEENREVIPLDQVPRRVREAVVAVEDSRFYRHAGVDVRALARALLVDASRGRVVEGGSTITQQYVKNTMVSTERSLRRKLREAALAVQLERRYSKDEILERYLNTVYFGQGAYGIQAAAATFFGHEAHRLSLPEGALLAGLIRSPARYDPLAGPVAARARRNFVLRRMREEGYLSPREEVRAARSPLGLKPRVGPRRYPAAYFVDYVQGLIQRDPRFRALGATVSERVNSLFKGGLRIYTTLDLRLQRAAEEASRRTLPYARDPYNAFVAMDPRTGAISAMVGGRDYFSADDPYAKLNLAVKSRRQPGSSFKPFTLVAALEQGIPLERVYRGGSAIDIPLPGGETWAVRNYESMSFGSELTLREATARSVNVVYAQVVREIGAAKVVEVARRMGVTAPLSPYPSIALGAQEVSPLELATGYATLANGGYAVAPTAITRITDARGKVLWRGRVERRRTLTPAIVALADDALRDVIARGTGRRQQIGRPAAGKTGTADEYHDAWFAGFVPQMVAVSWVGFPAGQVSMVPPRTRIRVVGGSWPGSIWRDFMIAALKGVAVEPFPSAEGRITYVRVDVSRNCLPNPFTPPYLVRLQPYLAGSEPTGVCSEPASGPIASVPSVVGIAADEARAMLESLGLAVTATPRRCPAYRPGMVCDQRPDPGAESSVGDAAEIFVSDDSAPPAPAATPSPSPSASPSASPSPSPSASPSPSGKSVEVPMALGLSDHDAVDALEKAGLEAHLVSLANEGGHRGCRDPAVEGSGAVWLQNPCPGERVPAGSVVAIYVNP
ncbi:MAG: PBP1A family penicillin-binding protein [Acidobacteria bacterium]|nr:PBP1A family penicillin-binding protein [Acidobacteriota bacterium]